jgi:hypothetical protein
MIMIMLASDTRTASKREKVPKDKKRQDSLQNAAGCLAAAFIL